MEGKEVKKQAVDITELICIGFDGKQDVTLAHTSGILRKIKEEYYAIFSYPEERYIDHVMLESSKSIDIAKEILLPITETNSLQTLAAVVCDGTVKPKLLNLCCRITVTLLILKTLFLLE